MDVHKWFIRQYKRLKSELLYSPRGRLVHWILKQSVTIIIIVYILIHLTIVTLFSFLYMKSGSLWDVREKHITTKFVDCFHFSITT